VEKSILVIDDDRLVTNTLRNLLSRGGYSARASNSGDEALDEIFEGNHFDLIVCDLRLPGINGIEVMKRIREYLKSKNRPQIPTIFITGYANGELHNEAKKLGKVFLKPFDNREFLKEIKEHL